MSHFDTLLATGRAMTREQRDYALKMLFLSPHAPALLVLVKEEWESYAQAISRQPLATHHGCLEHCAGSLHALENMEGRFRSVLTALEQESKKKK